jgi:Holliday junction resolvase RusA-like endonuclease
MNRYFAVFGKIRGKQRAGRVNRRGKTMTFTPTQTRNYETLIKQNYFATYKKAPLLTGSLRLDLKAHFAIPKSYSKDKRQLCLEDKIRPTTKPDGDNIAKIFADALNKVAYQDDSQIVEWEIKKFYGEVEAVGVTITEIG